MQRTRISVPIQIDQRPHRPGLNIIRLDGKRPVQDRCHILISPEILVAERNLLKGEEVARIEFDCALQVSQRLRVFAATAFDVTLEFEYTRIVG